MDIVPCRMIHLLNSDMKRIITTAFMAFAMMLPTLAKAPIEIELWPDGAPNDNGLPVTAEAEANAFVTGVSKAVLYVFPAENPNGTAVVMLPGGAYLGVAIEHEGLDMADWFNTMGISYAVLKYRMPAGHREVPLSDAEQAMRIMRSKAVEWGIDPSSVGVMGASAGGHLAASLSTMYSSDETRPDFQILFYPVISMSDDITHYGSREALLGHDATDADKKRYSTELNVNARTPRAFIMVSADDEAVPLANSLRYFDALTQSGVFSSMHIYPSGGHGWGFRDSFKYKREWTTELEDWLSKEIISKRH